MTVQHEVQCPSEDCQHVFTVNEPAEESTDLIECPECGEEWEWELDEDGELVLLPDDEGDNDDEFAAAPEDEDEEDAG